MATALAPDDQTMDDQAIVVGIGRYPCLGPKRTPLHLHGPVRDAHDVAAWLARNGSAVKLITSDGIEGARLHVQDLRPEVGDVQRPFNTLFREAEDLADAGRRIRLGRRLTIYMAGHGFSPARKQLALITAEASQGVKLGLQATAWADFLVDQPHFDEIVLWMDCCTVNDYALTSGGPIGIEATQRAGGPAKQVSIWAAKPDQFAYERADADGTVRGVFTTQLLRGLNGAAAGPGGWVTTESLKRYFDASGVTGSDPVASSAEEVAGKPHFRDADPIEFARAELPMLRIHTGAAEGTFALIQRDGDDWFDGQVGPGGVIEAQLGPGIYKLRAGGPAKLFEIGAGSETDVAFA